MTGLLIRLVVSYVIVAGTYRLLLGSKPIEKIADNTAKQMEKYGFKKKRYR